MVEVNFKDNRLAGGAIFFKNNSLVSWVVRLGGLLTYKHGFKLSKYSHVGTLFWNDEVKEIWIIEALKPVVLIRSLEECLAEFDGEYEILSLHQSQLHKYYQNIDNFNKTIKNNIGREYSNYTAITSELDIFPDDSKFSRWINKKLKPKAGVHCSYLDGLLLQSLDLYHDCCKELTPEDNYSLRKHLI